MRTRWDDGSVRRVNDTIVNSKIEMKNWNLPSSSFNGYENAYRYAFLTTENKSISSKRYEASPF